MPIEVRRGPLLIRTWWEPDAAALSAAIEQNLAHLTPFLPWAAAEPLTLDERRLMIAGWATESMTGSDDVVGLFLDGVVVGGAGLHHRVGPGGLEIGYWVHREFTRRGLATAVAGALTDVAFTRPGIDRVEIRHDVANAASAGVPWALGFTFVGEERHSVEAPAQTGVQRVWRINRAEWVGLPRP